MATAANTRPNQNMQAQSAWLHLVCWAALLLGACAQTPRLPDAQRSPPAVEKSTGAADDVQLQADQREATVARALLLVNTPYRYGGNTIEGGFDCSGLVTYVMAQGSSKRVPRTTAQWAAASRPVREPQLGDLVFFNTQGTPFSHMGIYVGQGRFVHAPSSGGQVRQDRLSNPYFARRYSGARSVFER